MMKWALQQVGEHPDGRGKGHCYLAAGPFPVVTAMNNHWDCTKSRVVESHSVDKVQVVLEQHGIPPPLGVSGIGVDQSHHSIHGQGTYRGCSLGR